MKQAVVMAIFLAGEPIAHDGCAALIRCQAESAHAAQIHRLVSKSPSDFRIGNRDPGDQRRNAPAD
jgi:hypothetical protein